MPAAPNEGTESEPLPSREEGASISPAIIPDWIWKELTHRDHERTSAALEELEKRLGSLAAVPDPLLGLLVHGHDAVRKRARQMIESIDPDWYERDSVESSLATFVKALGSLHGHHVANAALEALHRIGRRAAPLLAACLEDPEESASARMRAAQALGRLGANATAYVPALVRCLSAAEEAQMSRAVAEALVKIGLFDEEVKKAAVWALSFRTAETRVACANILGHTVADEALLRTLLPLLRDRDDHVRTAVVEALVRQKRTAVPVLVELLHERDLGDFMERWNFESDIVDSVRKADEEALRREPGRALQNRLWWVRERVNDGVYRVHESVLLTLERVGPDAGAAATDLIEMTRAGPLALRVLAMRALGAVGPDCETAASAVLQGLVAADPSVRRVASQTLSKMHLSAWNGSPAARETAAQLLDQMPAPEREESGEWIAALLQLGEPSIEAAIDGIQEQQGRTKRQASAAVLAAFGGRAVSALPLLEQAMARETNSLVADALAQAVRKISAAGA